MKRSTFIILCLEGAVLSFNVAAAAALVPSIAGDFRVSPFIAGRIIWLYMFPYGLAALLYGPLIRFYDARNVELSCIFLFSAVNLLAGFSQGIFTLFVSRFLAGVFGASVIPLALILLSNHIENNKRGRLVGVFFAATFVSSLAGLFFSGILHWRMIFFIPAVLGFLLFVLMYFYLPAFRQEKATFKINYSAALRSRPILSIFAYIFLISLFYHGIQQWLGVYLERKYNFGQFFISMLVTLTSLSGIFGEVWGGWSADIIGRLKTINIGIILMIVGVVLFLFRMPALPLVLAAVIWGLGWAVNHAGVSVSLTDLPKSFLNESASLNSSVRFISGGLGVALGGWFMQRGLEMGFAVFGFCLLGLLFLSKPLEHSALRVS
ncbi:MAG: MFS transporter [Candidatus Omnitrophota bacterium]